MVWCSHCSILCGLALMTAVKGQLSHDYPLARLTSWRVGGCAQTFYRPKDLEDLAVFLRTLPPEEPLTWLGLGSNTLIRDGGILGTVIVTQAALTELELKEDNIIHAQAGVSCAQLARFAARNGFAKSDFAVGIPGTVGGALMMNAGALGGETWSFVQSVEVIDRTGRIETRYPEQFKIGYRSVIGLEDNTWFVAGEFKFPQGDKTEAFDKIHAHLAHRKETQPINLPSGGSVFRNPTGDHAARLIEASGLKGKSIGGAKVSEKHANFIVNTGDCLAADIEQLISVVHATVERDHGISLHPEVRIIGEHLK